MVEFLLSVHKATGAVERGEKISDQRGEGCGSQNKVVVLRFTNLNT